MGAVRGWSRFAIVMLAISMATSVLVIVALAGRLDILDRVNDATNPATLEEATASDQLVAVSSLGWLLAYLATAAAFIGWLFSCAKLVQRVRPDLLRHKTGWAIGAWFVPFLNLARPPQIVNDVRRLGDTGVRPRGRKLVGWWWALLLVSNVSAWAVVASNPSSLDALRGQTNGQLLREGLHLTAGVLAILVVLSTSRWIAAGVAATGWSEWQPYGYVPGYPTPAYPQPPTGAAVPHVTVPDAPYSYPAPVERSEPVPPAPEGWSPPSADPR